MSGLGGLGQRGCPPGSPSRRAWPGRPCTCVPSTGSGPSRRWDRTHHRPGECLHERTFQNPRGRRVEGPGVVNGFLGGDGPTWVGSDALFTCIASSAMHWVAGPVPPGCGSATGHLLRRRGSQVGSHVGVGPYSPSAVNVATVTAAGCEQVGRELTAPLGELVQRLGQSVLACHIEEVAEPADSGQRKMLGRVGEPGGVQLGFVGESMSTVATLLTPPPRGGSAARSSAVTSGVDTQTCPVGTLRRSSGRLRLDAVARRSAAAPVRRHDRAGGRRRGDLQHLWTLVRGTVHLRSRQPADVMVAAEVAHHRVDELHPRDHPPRPVLGRDCHPHPRAGENTRPSRTSGRIRARTCSTGTPSSSAD